MPEEQYIYADDNCYQHQNVKQDRHISGHFDHQCKCIVSRLPRSSDTSVTYLPDRSALKPAWLLLRAQAVPVD
jgi:hypothetical protein